MTDRATDADLLVSQEGGVLTVTFNRPAARNSMTFAMYEGLFQACERADADDSVRAMVLTGAGDKAFVAGTGLPATSTVTGSSRGLT